MTSQQACEYIKQHESKLRYYANFHWNKRLANNGCAAAWEAEDLYQETITRALENLHQFKGGDFGHWVGAIMTNLSCTLIDKYKREEDRNKRIFGDGIQNQTVEDALDRETTNVALYEAIDELPPNQGITLLYTMSHAPEYGDYVKLSKELGISHNSLKQLRFQAIRKLGSKLAPYNPK